MRTRAVALLPALAAILAAVPSLPAQTVAGQVSQPIGDVRYTVTYDRATAARDVIQVSMSFSVMEEAPVVLSLPAWTPGSYELDHFARFVSNFAATAATDGQRLKVDRLDFDTWAVTPGGHRQLTVSFDFGSDTLDTGMAYMAPDFAFFNGTNLFLFPQGQSLAFPAEVRMETESDWQVATGFTRTGAGVYHADDYHDLVDMPTFIGRFDLDSAQVEGTWFRLATYPEGTVAGEARARLWGQIQRMMPPMSVVFGGMPWHDYTVLMAFSPDYPGGSALEHGNSHLGIYNSQFVGTDILASVVAHEIFHAWNVKRLRPADLVPYAYDRPQPTTLLWMSEGITDYYADLALVRGGITDAAGFYQTTARKMESVATSPPVALEDASVSTWIEPADGTAFIYYDKGSLVGLLLDILIRDATDNERSLDDVMGDLYRSTYLHGRGFTHIDFWQAVGRATRQRSFADFYAEYVDGVEPFPYDEVLPLAGLRLQADTVHLAVIGMQTQEVDSAGATVSGVVPGSMAALAGVMVGDVLVRAGDVAVTSRRFGTDFRRRYADEAEGTPVMLTVRRDGALLELTGALAFEQRVRYQVVEDPDAPAKATAIRTGILTGS